MKFRFKQDTRCLTGEGDILGPHIAEIFIPFPVISSTMQPKCKGKGKAVPLQAWTGPEVYTRLRLPDSMTIGA